mmetsp:Transcript_15689/g.48792  ORF Transcript_15689/g.48792 Transcript_15689/m.48792 type:complete len:258 (-) Transcript_15689:129-902(-)
MCTWMRLHKVRVDGWHCKGILKSPVHLLTALQHLPGHRVHRPEAVLPGDAPVLRRGHLPGARVVLLLRDCAGSPRIRGQLRLRRLEAGCLLGLLPAQHRLHQGVDTKLPLELCLRPTAGHLLLRGSPGGPRCVGLCLGQRLRRTRRPGSHLAPRPWHRGFCRARRGGGSSLGLCLRSSALRGLLPPLGALSGPNPLSVQPCKASLPLFAARLTVLVDPLLPRRRHPLLVLLLPLQRPSIALLVLPDSPSHPQHPLPV